MNVTEHEWALTGVFGLQSNGRRRPLERHHGGHRPTACVGFDAPATTAATQRTAGLDDNVADLAGRAARSVERSAIEHQRTADPGSHPDTQDVVDVVGCTRDPFAEQTHVHIVAQSDRYMQRCFKLGVVPPLRGSGHRSVVSTSRAPKLERSLLAGCCVTAVERSVRADRIDRLSLRVHPTSLRFQSWSQPGSLFDLLIRRSDQLHQHAAENDKCPGLRRPGHLNFDQEICSIRSSRACLQASRIHRFSRA